MVGTALSVKNIWQACFLQSNDYFNLNRLLHQTQTEIASLGKLISDFSEQATEDVIPGMGFGN